MSSESIKPTGSVLFGTGLALVLHFAFAAVCLTFGSLVFEGPGKGLRPLMWIGVTQWLYLLPAAIVAVWRRRWRTLGGLLCAGAITILLNAAGLWLAFHDVG